MKITQSTYEIGDIVYVSRYRYKNGKEGKGHLFVVIDVETNKLVPMEYFGMLVSSHIEKSKDNSDYIYNEPLDKKITNGLKDNSIVKCDELYSISPKNIIFKIGSVDVDDYIRFIQASKK